PHFKIKNKFQKRPDLYSEILTPDILEDVCMKITGRPEYTVHFDNSGYNKGRLAILEHDNAIYYISFSETEIRSRNSALQCFPSSLIGYHLDYSSNKSINFYFLRSSGNQETDYFVFMYRIMKTAGTRFLNASEHLKNEINSFNSVEDLITQRDLNRART